MPENRFVCLSIHSGDWDTQRDRMTMSKTVTTIADTGWNDGPPWYTFLNSQGCPEQVCKTIFVYRWPAQLRAFSPSRLENRTIINGTNVSAGDILGYLSGPLPFMVFVYVSLVNNGHGLIIHLDNIRWTIFLEQHGSEGNIACICMQTHLAKLPWVSLFSCALELRPITTTNNSS